MSRRWADSLVVLALALLVQTHGDNGSEARDSPLLLDVSWAVNATRSLSASAAATQTGFVDLRQRFLVDVAASAAVVIDGLDTLGVIPSQLLSLQVYILEASSTVDELLGDVLARMINYRALTGAVTEHLVSRVAALPHDLAQLTEDTGVLIALMDSSLDFAFARYELLCEIFLDLAHSFTGQDVAEIEDLLNKTDDLLIASYTPYSLHKFALEGHYHDAVAALQSLIAQIRLMY